MEQENRFCSSEIEMAKNHLINRVSPYVIYLFGSITKNGFRSDSDIDIAFLSDVIISDYDLFLTAQEIADICGRDIDLIDLTKASAVLKAQIVGSGNVVFCNDKLRRMYYEMCALKEYAFLNEERAKIMEKINESGQIYG